MRYRPGRAVGGKRRVIRLVDLPCQQCGKTMYQVSSQAKYCDECKAVNLIAARKKRYAEGKDKPRKSEFVGQEYTITCVRCGEKATYVKQNKAGVHITCPCCKGKEYEGRGLDWRRSLGPKKAEDMNPGDRGYDYRDVQWCGTSDGGVMMQAMINRYSDTLRQGGRA